MATYGTDLTTIDDADDATSWGELNSPYNAGGTPATDGENWIQGVDCISQSTGSKSGLQFSIVYDAGSDQSANFTTGICLFVWSFYAVGTNIQTLASGGMRVVIAADQDNGDAYAVGGSDFGRNPYGGWMNVVVDPSLTADYTIGSGNGGVYRWFGTMPNTLAAIAKGTPHAVDAIRYGRGEIYCTGTGCDFAGMAQYNDYNDATNGYNRFGLFQENGGYYLWKGLMSIGQTGTAATFSDSNKTIIIDDQRKVTAGFNTIAIRNASTSVTWDNISFKSLNAVSPGIFTMVAAATVSMTGCTFNDMDAFSFLGNNASVLGCIFNGCGIIGTGGGNLNLTGSKILSPTVAAASWALSWSTATNPDGYLDDMEFLKGAAAHHAIRFSSAAPATMTLRGIAFGTGWGTTGTTSATLRFDDTGSDRTWNVSLVGCTGTITYYKVRATDTVNLIIDPVTTTVTVRDAETTDPIQGARVLLLAADGTGDLPYQATLSSLTSSGTTATATFASAHGLAPGDIIFIEGASPNDYNGAWVVQTTPSTTEATYTLLGTATSPATGTIKATGGIFNETTDVNGQVTDSRSITNDQPVTGRVRKSTSSPFYKTSPTISEVIDASAGLSVTIYLSPDE